MPIPFIMPKMDMDQEEVYIDEWLKKEGDTVEKGETVIVVETDKITSEIEAPASGRLARILYKEKEIAPVTKVVAYILQEGETEADLPDMEKPTAQTTQETAEVEKADSQKSLPATALAMRIAETEDIDLKEVPAKGQKITKEDVDAFLINREKIKPRVEIPATPAARRIAFERSVDLKTVEGTGPKNRVQASDVLKAADQQEYTSPASQKPLSTLEPLELTSMRKRIAERLTASYQTIPHIFLTVEVDMARSESFRRQLSEKSSEKRQSGITMTAYMVKVVSECLKRHPFLNTYLDEDRINFWEEINIGVATAMKEGLIVPVIHQADKRSVFEINQEVKLLSQKAREGNLVREEIQGGTFTISNLGMYGITSFTSIINPPQVAILSVGAIKRRPVVVDDEDSINVRPIMNLTLAADHRIVDGAAAANFLVDLVNLLEKPIEMAVI